MGKGSKRQKGGEGPARNKNISSMPKQIRNDILEVINELERVLSSTNTKFDDSLELIEIIRRKQQAYARKPLEREKHFKDLLKWATQNDVDCSKVSIASFDKCGYGLKAVTDIKKGEAFLKIPDKMILNSNPFIESYIGKLLNASDLMPSYSLAMNLLIESLKPDSFWSPYIKALPSTYPMLMYFNKQEMTLLRDTSILYQVFKLYRVIVAQYIKFYKKLEAEPDKEKIWPLHNFCFDDFKWAICTTMTRQNPLKALDGHLAYVLIPLWDMCNHGQGSITTNYLYEENACASEAMRDFKQGEQIEIFYGKRSIDQIFIYGGYVIEDFPRLDLPLKIGVSAQDPLNILKKQVLGHLGMDEPYNFRLSVPLNPESLAFIRVFKMEKENLIYLLDHLDFITLVTERSYWISPENEYRAWHFLAERCQLIQKSYRNSLEEDMDAVRKVMSENSQLITRLRIQEKKMMRRVEEFCNTRLSYISGYFERYKPTGVNVEKPTLSSCEVERKIEIKIEESESETKNDGQKLEAYEEEKTKTRNGELGNEKVEIETSNGNEQAAVTNVSSKIETNNAKKESETDNDGNSKTNISSEQIPPNESKEKGTLEVIKTNSPAKSDTSSSSDFMFFIAEDLRKDYPDPDYYHRIEARSTDDDSMYEDYWSDDNYALECSNEIKEHVCKGCTNSPHSPVGAKAIQKVDLKVVNYQLSGKDGVEVSNDKEDNVDREEEERKERVSKVIEEEIIEIFEDVVTLDRSVAEQIVNEKFEGGCDDDERKSEDQPMEDKTD